MNCQDTFIKLVRLGIGHSADLISGTIDWNGIQALAERQGLSAIIVDGVERLPEDKRPPKPVLLQWIGEVLQGYEYRYELYRRAIAEMAGFYNSHGFKMMVLKGYACSLDWPKPEHRPTGDIDIWQFGRWKEADSLVEKEKGISVERDHHHHTVFMWRDFMVENHYDILNVRQHRSNVGLEKIIKGLANDDTHFVDVYGEKVYLPSSNLHALFLLRHAMTHFAATEINIRHLLDWAFFVKAHGNEVDWSWLFSVLEKYGMMEMFKFFNAICTEDLGFVFSDNLNFEVDMTLKCRVLNDILSPEFMEKESGNVFSRAILKYRRWVANRWKHDLCFNDSRWSVFWAGICGHLIKPRID